MPNRSLSRRVLRLIAAAEKSARTLHQVKKAVDDYLTDGIGAERSMAAIALSITHSEIAELDAAVAEFGGAA